MKVYQPLQNVAYDYLYQKILSGKMDTSITYSSTKMAQEIGISRTPMRDAIQRLSQDGFIDVLPGSGFRVHQLTREDIIEIAQIRCAIESYCGDALAQDAAGRGEAVKKTLSELETIMEKMEAVPLTYDNIKSFIKLDNQFHTAIVLYVHNPMFCEIYQKYLFQMEQFLFRAMHIPSRMECTLAEHRSIYNAILHGDTLQIFKQIKSHLNHASTYLIAECPSET